MKRLRDIRTTGKDLKIIATVAMAIDHIGGSLIERYLATQEQTMTYDLSSIAGGPIHRLEFLDLIMRLPIGRMALPIFIFLLVEGFIHTQNILKYLLTVFCFALISEVPFDFAFKGVLFDGSYQNVMFTLFIGLAMLAVCKWLTSAPVLEKIPLWIRKIVVVIVFLLCGSIAEIALCDYGASAIVTIAAVYLCRDSKQLAAIVTVLSLGMFNTAEFYGILAVIPMMMYGGQRGNITRRGKYAFYAFYPAHLIVLGLIALAMGI